MWPGIRLPSATAKAINRMLSPRYPTQRYYMRSSSTVDRVASGRVETPPSAGYMPLVLGQAIVDRVPRCLGAHEDVAGRPDAGRIEQCAHGDVYPECIA